MTVVLRDSLSVHVLSDSLTVQPLTNNTQPPPSADDLRSHTVRTHSKANANLT